MNNLNLSPLQSRVVLLGALVAVSLGLMAFRNDARVASAKTILLWPLSALQNAMAAAQTGVEGFIQPQESVDELRQRVVTLETENARLQAELIDLREISATVSTLNQLLNYQRQVPNNTYVTANVIGRDPSPFLSYLILDRGTDSGLRRDMPVVTARGLVGRIVEITSSACKVLPITDPTSAVNARVQDSREEGTVVGQVGGGLELQFVSQQAKLQPGQFILTSGLGGVYPPGLAIGTVNAVQRLDYEVLQKADLSPAVDLRNLEIVLIITNFQPPDTAPFFEPSAPTPAP